MGTPRIRLHKLAKELGVSSRTIIDRCRSENIPSPKSHMALIQEDLAETIRGWFKSRNEM